MAEHVGITNDSGMLVFFCDPRGPGQHPTIENLKGFLPQSCPRSADLTTSRIGRSSLRLWSLIDHPPVNAFGGTPGHHPHPRGILVIRGGKGGDHVREDIVPGSAPALEERHLVEEIHVHSLGHKQGGRGGGLRG